MISVEHHTIIQKKGLICLRFISNAFMYVYFFKCECCSQLIARTIDRLLIDDTAAISYQLLYLLLDQDMKL